MRSMLLPICLLIAQLAIAQQDSVIAELSDSTDTVLVPAPKLSRLEIIRLYISQFSDLAVEEMIRTGVPASIKLAQGILESDAGRSELVLRSNNHFGIKCKSSWTGEKVFHNDDETGECFRKYATAEESFRDHSSFLQTQPRYRSLFQLDPEDYAGWANGLRAAGYATNPQYPKLLIQCIEQYSLNEFCILAKAKMHKEPINNSETSSSSQSTNNGQIPNSR